MKEKSKTPGELVASFERARASLLAATNIKPVTSVLQNVDKLPLCGTRFADVLKQIDKSPLYGARLGDVFKQIEASAASLRPMTKLADLAKAMESQTGPLRFAGFHSAALEAIQSHSARWRFTMESLDASVLRCRPATALAEEAARSALASSTGLSEAIRRITEMWALDARPSFASRLLAPSLVHARFAEETFSLIRQAAEPKLLKALSASLNLVDAQHVANAEILSALTPASTDDEESSSTWDLNAPFVQRDELLSQAEIEDDEDIELVVSHSPAAQEAEQARAVLLLTIECNKASRTRGPSEIFKPTNKVLEAFGNLPWLIPHDERSLGEFVDGLYFIAYEGAGKDKLRFLQDYGGPLNPGDCDIIWSLKTLRNKWLRHDIDHGKDSDINKSWQSLDECLRRLGLKRFPRSSADYRLLHRRLLDEMRAFLSRLLEAI